RRPYLVQDLGPRAAPPVGRLAGVDLPPVRGRVPGEDAGVPAARLDARRLPRDADTCTGAALGGPVEGRRVRLPPDRPAADAGRLAALPGADDRDRGGVDPVRVRARVLAGRRAARGRLLVRRAARLHHARDLLPGPEGRAGRGVPD